MYGTALYGTALYIIGLAIELTQRGDAPQRYKMEERMSGTRKEKNRGTVYDKLENK